MHPSNAPEIAKAFGGIIDGFRHRIETPQSSTDDADEPSLHSRLGTVHLLGDKGGDVSRYGCVACKQVIQVGWKRADEERDCDIVGLFDDQRREGIYEYH